MTRIRIIIGLLLLSLVSLASVALAASPVTVIIPLETIVKGDPGEILSVRDPIPVSELDAEPGWFCTVAVIAGNGESEHDGSNLIIGSNGDEVKALDVEASAGGVTEAAGTLTLGETVTFDGQLGEDGVISAGMNVVFECFEERPPPSTTTTTVTVTTTVPPTSTSTTTIPTTTTTVLSPSSTTTTNPTVSTTVPPDGTTSTTEVPPPTLIESGDAGYIGEADDGHEHGDEGFDWLFFGVASVFALGTGVLAFFVVKRIQERS